LDTNVLAYAEGVNGAAMKKVALELIEALAGSPALVPVQALGELFNLLVKKAGRSAAKAHSAILGWRDAFSLIETSTAVMLGAADLARDHHLSIWDAVIVAASSETGCRVLLSEDLHEGFTWRGVTVVNPFAAKKHPLLAAILQR
jgi:predicted nucleic acid-binding protein